MNAVKSVNTVIAEGHQYLHEGLANKLNEIQHGLVEIDGVMRANVSRALPAIQQSGTEIAAATTKAAGDALGNIRTLLSTLKNETSAKAIGPVQTIIEAISMLLTNWCWAHEIYSVTKSAPLISEKFRLLWPNL